MGENQVDAVTIDAAKIAATGIVDSSPRVTTRRYEQLTREQQAEAMVKATQKVLAEIQDSTGTPGGARFNFSGEAYEVEDVEKRFNEAIEPLIGHAPWDEVLRIPTVRELIWEEATRRVYRRRYAIVPDEVEVLRGG